MVIRTKDLCKFYGEGTTMVKALDNVNISVERGELIGVVGRSGSGKSTLLNMLGALDRPTSGSVEIGGRDISRMNDEQLTAMRRSKIGFIFQNYNLIPVLNVYENIVMPIQLDGKKPDTQYIRSILDALEISHKISALPASLSGGQQQRVAIARALANRPEIVLADEPTGNLDEAMGEGVVNMLRFMNREFDQTIIVVTHDQDVAEKMNRNIRVADGRVSS